MPLVAPKPRIPKIYTLNKGLIHCYPFYEYGGTILHDIWGTNDGTLTSFADLSAAWALQESGRTLFFNSTNSEYVDLGELELGNKSNFTINVWTKVTALNTKTLISEGHTGNANPTLYIEQSAAEVARYFQRSGATSVLLDGTTDINNAWHMITVTRDGTSYKLYVDGVLEDSDTTTVDSYDTNNTTLGALRRTTTTGYLDGYLADIRIYDVTLSAAEIKDMYVNPWGIYSVVKIFGQKVPLLYSQDLNDTIREIRKSGHGKHLEF